jgi:membrane dipeptidase
MPDEIAARAGRLFGEALVWDNTFPFGPSCGSHMAHVRTLERMAASGYTCVSLTTASDNEDMPLAMKKIARDLLWFRRNADRYIVVDRAEDVARAKREGKLAVVFTFQGTLPFEREIGFVEMYYRLGVRQALMAYNQKNHVGDGCHERTDAGLSRFGIDLVREMNRVGMIVDCTHTGYRTSMDVFEVAEGPVVFSHSNPRALVDHERNIRDDQAKACARTGGVVGVNGVGIFLGDPAARTETVFRHIDYWVELIGPDHVGVALDFVSDIATLTNLVREKSSDKYPPGQNYDQDLSFAAPEQMPELAEAMLRHGYADDHVRGVLGGNWLRVATQVWK